MTSDSPPPDKMFTISEQWDVLGPFRIGTREAPWGADPLEQQGGFRNLSAADDVPFHSSLSPDGLVKWSKQHLETVAQKREATEVEGAFAFPDVDWQGLQAIYGWSALQYQGWARAELSCHTQSTQRVAIYTDYILEFWIDDQHFFGGDFYAFRKAPVIVSLSPGQHQIDIRLVRDVRSMGGVSAPQHPVAIRIESCSEGLRADESAILVPDFVNGRGLPSPYGSVPLCNTGTELVHIHEVHSLDDRFKVACLKSEPLKLEPGQTRPFGVRIIAKQDKQSQLRLAISYTMGDSQLLHLLNLETTVYARAITEPVKSTFLHPSGIVSYCVVVAPREQSAGAHAKSSSFPVLLNLHGAGVEADSNQVRHQYDAVGQISAWTIFPSGVTSWCGDDWHTWGFADVEAAVESIPDWIEAVGWAGPGIKRDRWYVVGHSNGGQGTWFALTHKPDLVRAAAPVSGYSSIQAYVSYNLWNEMDPVIWTCIQASLASYRHETLLPNAVGASVIVQHGSADENVPVAHSRRMVQLLSSLGHPPQYHELKGKGHWYDGIMITPALLAFYEKIAGDSDSTANLPRDFQIVVPNSGDMGSRGGIQVDRLMEPASFGYVDVERQDAERHWKLRTKNIGGFHFNSSFSGSRSISVDGDSFNAVQAGSRFQRRRNGSWKPLGNEDLGCVSRDWSQTGTIGAILRTKGMFHVRYLSPSEFPIALQISRNLLQYFGADSEIVQGAADDPESPASGTSVQIWKGLEANAWFGTRGQITIGARGISMRRKGLGPCVIPAADGLGAIFLGAGTNGAAVLRVWGWDDAGLRQAARFVPMLTGTGQPDFIVVGRECSWKGAAGVKALGFYDSEWEISSVSYLPLQNE